MARIIGMTPGGVEIAAWIFKARPDLWDVGRWISDHHRGEGGPIGSWPVPDGPRVELVAAGQPCFLWVTGPAGARLTPGVWAWGTVTGPAADEDGANRSSVPIELTVLDEVIARSELRADPRFRSCEILRAPRVGNPVVVAPGELAVLEEWLHR